MAIPSVEHEKALHFRGQLVRPFAVGQIHRLIVHLKVEVRPFRPELAEHLSQVADQRFVHVACGQHQSRSAAQVNSLRMRVCRFC